MKNQFSKLENNVDGFNKKIIFTLFIVFLSGLTIRLFHIPYDLPISYDAFNGYFLYALDIKILGHLPDYTLAQSGWSEFLSLFFMNYNSENLTNYYNLQRTLSVVISSFTIIPIFFICKKFLNNTYSLIGSIIFAVQPRIITNSTLGVSEPLYILAITLGVLLFLNLNKKIIFASFVFFACATIIRPEGQFWFYTFSIIYLFRFRNNRKEFLMYFVCLAVFLLVLSPIVIHRIECCGDDAIIGRILIEISHYEKNLQTETITNSISYGPNFENGIKLIGWGMIPIFVIFVPIGLIPILKKLRFPEYLLISIPAILALPIIYSVSIAPDARYLYPLFPIFCVISAIGIKYIIEKIDKKKFIILLVSCIILGSMIFLDYEKIDYSEDIQAYKIAKLIIDDVKGVNKGTIVSDFFKNVEIEKRMPITEYTGRLSESYEIKRFSIKEYDHVNKFISDNKEDGLTHIIVDNSHKMSDFLIDVFENEEKYEYLIKEFDSKNNGEIYHVKKFKINYELFKIEN